MSEAPAKRWGYTRKIAIVTLTATAAYIAMVRAFPDSRQDLVDLSFAVPIIYVLAVFGVSLVTVLKPVRNRRTQQAIRGVLEGALLAYSWVVFVYFLNDSSQRTDSVFRWATFYVGLMLTGPLFSSLGAIAHLLYDAVSPRHHS